MAYVKRGKKKKEGYGTCMYLLLFERALLPKGYCYE